MPPGPGPWFASAAFLLWLLLCLGLYSETLLQSPLQNALSRFLRFWTPARLDPAANAWALLALAGPLIVLALHDAAAWTCGTALLRWAWRGNRLGIFAVPVTAGLAAVLPAGLLGLGLTGLWRGPLLWMLAIAASLPALRRAATLARPRLPCPPTVLAGVLLLPSLICALAPEIQYDALQYHLALPRRFLAAGRFCLADPWPHCNFHLAVETLFIPAIAMAGDAAAKLVNWQFLPLTLLLAARAAQAAGMTGTAAHLPWFLLAISPLFSDIAGRTFTDGGPTAAVTAAVICRLASRSGAASFACGVFLGAAGTAKIPSAVYGLAALLFLAPRRSLALAGWALPLAAWPAKNFLLTGSPFGGIAFTKVWPSFLQGETCLDFLGSGQWTPAGDISLWLAFPLTLLRDAVNTGYEFTPLLVMLLPGLLARTGGTEAALRNAALAAFALWPLTGGGQVRFLAPFVPLVILACLPPLWTDAGRALSRHRLFAVLLAAGAAGFMRTTASLYALANPLNTATGLEEKSAYLARIIGPAPLYTAVGRHLEESPALGRPYAFGDIKSYYWPRNPVNDSQFLFPRLFRWSRDSRDSRELLAKFRQERLGCLVYRMEGAYTIQMLAGGYPWTDRQLSVLQRFWAEHLAPAGEFERPAENAFYYIYAVARRASPPSPSKLHWLNIPGTEGILHEADLLLGKGRGAEAEAMYRQVARKYPHFALIPLRLAEAARRRGDKASERAREREAARLLGLGKP